MPLRVAFDLDGTIADMHHALRGEAARLFGKVPEPAAGDEAAGEGEDEGDPPIPADLPLTATQQAQLWKHVKGIENFWNGLPEMEPGIVSRIAREARERRWEVIFLTTRPLVAGDTVQIQTQRWLEAHGYPLPSVFVVQKSRGTIAEALDLDAVVDDRPENCLDITLDSKAKAILVWRGEQEKVPLGVDRLSVHVAPSISDALKFLIEMDDDRRRSSVTRTIRKLFGKVTA